MTKRRVFLACLLPFLACGLQWALWDAIRPYVWFLFFPTAFLSAWIGGLAGGLCATVISALLVWFVFMPPMFSFALDSPAAFFSIVMFLFMGSLFAVFFERLRQSMRRTDQALATAEAARREITHLYQKTLELDALKSRFFANVSHELRTPLTLILAPLEQRLCRPVTAGSTEPERRETEIMLRNARLLYRHVTDLLDAAKLDAGRMTLVWAPLDLARLARVTASNFGSMAADRNIAYTVSVPETLSIEADGEKLERVLVNLLSNAFKFTPDGGAIALRLSDADSQALIEVADTGPGVPAALRDAVFERFRQGDDGATRRYGGIGLGLAIVKDFVDLHGGTVTLGEAPGGGALFSVRLPRAAPPGTVLTNPIPLDDGRAGPILEPAQDSRESPPPGEDAGPAADAPLVLVVEDNADMTAFLRDCLRPRYRVACARNGREGIEQALTLHPDLILADIMMPVMSGDEMVVALRQHTEIRHIPMILLTAKADDQLRVRMFREGVQGYLNKPFSVTELLARVTGLIEDRMQVKQERLRVLSLLGAISDSSDDAIFAKDLEGCYILFNRAAARFVGKPLAAVLGHDDRVLFAPEQAEMLMTFDRQVIALNRTLGQEEILETVNGPRVFLSTKGPLRDADGQVIGTFGISRDITKSKEDEIARKNHELSYRSLFNNIMNGYAHCVMIFEDGIAQDFIYLNVNPAFELQTGLKNVIGRKASDVIPGIRRSDPGLLDIYGRVATTGQPEHFERYVEALGMWFSISAYSPRHGQFVAVFDVITERKQAEEQINRLNANLERRVAERTAELSGANQELESFAYAVSHDLRAPLRAMSGFSQALIEDYGDTLTGEAGVYLNQIILACRKMGDLIEGILTLSRSTRYEMRRNSVDVSALATRALHELARNDPGRTVQWQVEPNLRAVGDDRMIEIVLSNLLDNAWKYTGQTEAPIIRVFAGETAGERRSFGVTDNGVGFDMNHANRLFQPFQRLHRQDEFPGIGIGLATVQRIIRRHGGEIRAEGHPGAGATFHFTLPIGASEDPS